MAGPLVTLVLARLRHRASTAAIAVAAVAAAVALIAIASGIGLIAADATVARTLDTNGADRPLVRVSHFSASNRDVDATLASAGEALDAGIGSFTAPPVRGVLTRELRDQAAPVFELVIAVDDPGAWTTVLEGRLPAPCLSGTQCEAILLAEVAPSFDFSVARPAPDVTLAIVGRGQIDPAVPFGDLDQRGPFGEMPIGGGDYQTGRSSPAVLLVNGVEALARMPALTTTGRTYVWAAPLDAGTIHPWTVGRFRATIEATTRALVSDDTAFTVSSPIAHIEAGLARAEAARGRLLLIGSLGVAILLAFAVFLALVVRDDVGAESARLAAVGAGRRDRAAFLILEAAIPAAIGGALGWIAGALVVAGLAAWSGVATGPVVAGALLEPTSLLAAGALLLVTIAATVVATAPGLPRGGAVRIAGTITATAAVLLGWQLATSGPLGETSLASAIASPIVVLLPPVLAFLVALLLTTAMPPLLQGLARRLRRAPLPVRLSLLSISREPGRPAATLTLLAFSIGAIVFATAWSASLRQGIDDAAAYRSGLDLRVSELGTGLSISRSVVPVERYAALGPDVRLVPVYRDASTTQPGGRVDILAIDPTALPTLPGWRDDFSATPVADLAARLVVPAPAGGWMTGGHRLPADARELALRFRYDGDPLRLDAIVSTDGGDATRVELGTIVAGMTSVRARLPDGAIGGRLTALIFRNDRIVAGSGHQHDVFRATVAFDGLDGLVDSAPIDLEVFTVSTVIIRAPQVTDGLVLPAIVSPGLAADAGPDGSLELHIGGGSVPLRVVGTADRAPTMTDPQPRFVVVPLDPFIGALAAAVPGAGRPSEMWISAPTPERVAEVRAALGGPPFRFAEVTSRADLVAIREGDPLSQAIVWALVVAALAGLGLSIGGLLLGTVTDLRDERGELADLEAQGVPPSALRWHALARTAWLAVGGAIGGLTVGIMLAFVVTGALAIDASGAVPIPPLVVVLPLLPIAVVTALTLGCVLGGVAWLARRTYGRPTLGDDRSRRGRSTRSTAWRPDPEQADG
jgi:hypothetical protein